MASSISYDDARLMKRGFYISPQKGCFLMGIYNSQTVPLKVNIRGKNTSPILTQERVPTREGISRIMRMASPRGRVSKSMMVLSGLRPESAAITTVKTELVSVISVR